MKLLKLSDVIIAKDNTPVTLDDLRCQVGTLACEDSRFNKKEDASVEAGFCGRPFVDDFIFKDGDWSAVIFAADGELYKVDFEIKNGKVDKLSDTSEKVTRQKNYVAATEPFKFNGKNILNGSGEIVKAADSEGGHLVSNEEGMHLPTEKNGKPDQRLMGAAWAALHGGYRGNKYEGPDKAKALKKLKAIYKAEGLECPTESSDTSGDESATIVCKDAGVPLVEKKWEFEKPVKFMWAPGGTSCITAGCMGKRLKLHVVGDESGAKAVESDFKSHVAAGTKNGIERRVPYLCIEHHEEERALKPIGFEWCQQPEPGIYCNGIPTKLGADNVSGGLHTSFSPSFRHDAPTSKAVCLDCKETFWNCDCGGVLEFPDGVRGSEKNPAHIIGVNQKSIGSLTNWPAFKDILPVTAKDEAQPAPAKPAEKSYKTRPEKAKGAASDAFLERHCAEINPKNAQNHADKASELAEEASMHASEAKTDEKAEAHHWAAAAHEQASRANDMGGNWKLSSHHSAQNELHKRYERAAKDETHPEHSRAMNFKASEPGKLFKGVTIISMSPKPSIFDGVKFIKTT